MKRIRGMRETSTPQARRGAGLPPSLDQLATQLSRLEHQRALLERQLVVWTEKRDMTAHRIRFIEKQITGLERQLWAGRKRPRAADGGAALRGAMPKTPPALTPQNAGRLEMPFEY